MDIGFFVSGYRVTVFFYQRLEGVWGRNDITSQSAVLSFLFNFRKMYTEVLQYIIWMAMAALNTIRWVRSLKQKTALKRRFPH